MSPQKTELNRILEIIGKITKISAGDDYIYRGEPECYERVSSNLWRELEKAKALHLDIESIQKAELEKAKRYIKKIDEFEILTEIQHFGGKTNLIDFTTDYYTALFFACNGSPSKDGRIILQNKNGRIKDWIREPQKAYPENRVGTQKSIFVRPPDGFVEPDIVIVIPKDLKHPLLNYIEKEFGISAEKVYGNIHGFIGSQASRLGIYKEGRKGIDAWENRDKADNLEEKNRDYHEAVKHFTNAIQQNPEAAKAYSERGLAYLSIGALDKALADFSRAIELNQRSAEAYNGRSIVYHAKGDFDNAIANLNEAIRLDPEFAEAYYTRGLTYDSKGEFNRAIEDYTKAIALKPHHVSSYYNRGEAWLHLQQWKKAKEDLITAKEMGMDIVAAFRNDYRDVAAFERTHRVKLPKDIVALVRQGFRHRYPMVEKALDSDGKPLESPEVLELLQSFRNAGPPLGEYIKKPSYFGIETVPTDVFVVDKATRDELIAAHPSSADILKPFLQGPDIKRWHIEPQDQWLIFTYRGIEINAYPAILKYLEKYKALLSKRGAEQEWYELQTSLEEVEHFAQPKLVCPNLYNTQTFALETEGLYCGYTCYVIPTNETWLCGLLNTLPVEWFYSQVSKQLDGGKLEARGDYIKQIPVPNINAAQKELVRKLVDYLVCLQQQPTVNSRDLAHARDSVMFGYFEWIVNGLVYEFYMPDVLQSADRDIFKHLIAEQLPEIDEIQGDKMSAFRSLYEHLHDREHPVRVNLFFQDSLRPIRIIEGKW